MLGGAVCVVCSAGIFVKVIRLKVELSTCDVSEKANTKCRQIVTNTVAAIKGSETGRIAILSLEVFVFLIINTCEIAWLFYLVVRRSHAFSCYCQILPQRINLFWIK
jgi:hypothetical protein